MRGFVAVVIDLAAAIRFIPACAGFCGFHEVIQNEVRVHPRMCGVLPVGNRNAVNVEGSSPHVRGFARAPARSVIKTGFIPACAGFWPTGA